MNQPSLSSLIWAVADLLRGDFKQPEYGRVILPFTVLRRLGCVLANTKPAVLAEYAIKQAADIAYEPFVRRKAGCDFFNVSGTPPRTPAPPSSPPPSPARSTCAPARSAAADTPRVRLNHTDHIDHGGLK